MISPLLAALVLAGLAATPVVAHVDLVSSDPADGAILATPPSVVSLRFSDGLVAAKSSFRLAGPSGAAGTGRPARDGGRVMVLDGLVLEPGEYTIRWTAGSLDGHVERGTLAFLVDEPAATSPPPSPGPSVEPSVAPTETPVATEAPATEAPSEPPTATDVPASTPEPDATTADPTTGDVIAPIVLGLLLVAGIGALVLRRSRGA